VPAESRDGHNAAGAETALNTTKSSPTALPKRATSAADTVHLRRAARKARQAPSGILSQECALHPGKGDEIPLSTTVEVPVVESLGAALPPLWRISRSARRGWCDSPRGPRITYYDEFYPSLAACCREELNLTQGYRSARRSAADRQFKVSADPQMADVHVLLQDPKAEPIPEDSFFDARAANPVEKYRDKIVLIGPTARASGRCS